MSNIIFSEYVNSSSFNLSLSSSQIRHLDLLARYGNRALVANGWNHGTTEALVRKGIIYHEANKGFFVTREGTIVHQLLEAAGYFNGGTDARQTI